MARRDAYSRMTRAAKLKRLDLFGERSLYRCARCRVQLEERDRAGHLERCWPEVLMERFTKVS